MRGATSRAAGVERWVKLEEADVLERAAPASGGVMIANPPYGERMGNLDELAAFYPKLGDALKQRFAGWRCFSSPPTCACRS
jgi:putative N6-adenine-specific DNA methylase